MAFLLSFFASITQFFCFLWAVFIRIFVSDVRANHKTGDIEAYAPGAIEAGAPAEIDAKDTLPCRHPHRGDVESGIQCSMCNPSDFEDIDINSSGQPIDFGSPIRRPSWHLHPVRSNAFETSLEDKQDRTIALDTDLARACQLNLRSERGIKKRGSLFDLISQFPDVPRHLPPGPTALAANVALFSSAASRNTGFSSPTSSENSTASFEVSGNGFPTDDTPDSSAPGTPQTQSDESLFPSCGQPNVMSPGKDNMANFRFGGYSGGARACDVSGKRPRSLVWFADAALNLPATPRQADEDEVLARELLRWEESRQRGLKAFREADALDMGFFSLASRGA